MGAKYGLAFLWEGRMSEDRKRLDRKYLVLLIIAIVWPLVVQLSWPRLATALPTTVVGSIPDSELQSLLNVRRYEVSVPAGAGPQYVLSLIHI